MSEVIPLPVHTNVFSHDRFQLHLMLTSLRAELGAVLSARHPDEIRADIADVEQQLKDLP